MRIEIRERFGLSVKDHRAQLCEYEHFLFLGMHGETPAAKQVKAYLMRSEESNRVAIVENQMLKNQVVAPQDSDHAIQLAMIQTLEKIADSFTHSLERMSESLAENTAMIRDLRQDMREEREERRQLQASRHPELTDPLLTLDEWLLREHFPIALPTSFIQRMRVLHADQTRAEGERFQGHQRRSYWYKLFDMVTTESN